MLQSATMGLQMLDAALQHVQNGMSVTSSGSGGGGSSLAGAVSSAPPPPPPPPPVPPSAVVVSSASYSHGQQQQPHPHPPPSHPSGGGGGGGGGVNQGGSMSGSASASTTSETSPRLMNGVSQTREDLGSRMVVVDETKTAASGAITKTKKGKGDGHSSALTKEGKEGTNGTERSKRQKTEDGAHDGQKCLGCGATSTPEWRRGPLGPRTLCNACGLVYAKLIKKRDKEKNGTGKKPTGGGGGRNGGGGGIVKSSNIGGAAKMVANAFGPPGSMMHVIAPEHAMDDSPDDSEDEYGSQNDRKSTMRE
ncbi:hypothetical protein CPC08DRAFT_218383 [Agrocybe pediades]|nr:hypothetical protein CPC08DRAFT_218383 [Agrocybe pediades]